MQMKIISLIGILALLNCASVKYNQHVAPDGASGYLRTYYSSANTDVAGRTDGTGIEQCKVQGSDVICKDLNVVHAEDIPLVAPLENPVKPAAPVATQPVKPAAPAAPVKK